MWTAQHLEQIINWPMDKLMDKFSTIPTIMPTTHLTTCFQLSTIMQGRIIIISFLVILGHLFKIFEQF